MKTKLIVNPAANRGMVGKRWPRVERILRAESFEFEYALTERRGHATELARAAVDAGFDLIVAVGGDGTLNEVVNGMIADGKAVRQDAMLGVISGGTGGDFARTAGLPRRIDAAARYLAYAAGSRPLDIGEVTFVVDGKEAHRYFANVAGMGFDGEVIERLERGGKRGGGTLPYLIALVTTISRYRSKEVTLLVDGQQVVDTMNSVVICNGKYFGGGMFVGPNAQLDDAKLDVIVLGDLGTLEFLMNVWKVYRGTHLTHPKVHAYMAQTVIVNTEQRMVIQADGELIGAGSATYRILPAALKLRV